MEQPRNQSHSHDDEHILPASVSQALSELYPIQVLHLMGVKNPLGGPPDIPADTRQTNPIRWYVYAHKDESGSIFYVGKGKGNRAWRYTGRDRHIHWHWYVKKHLHDKYSVEILADDLEEGVAELIEDSWMSYLDPDRLINWANYYKNDTVDEDAYSKAYGLRYKTQQLIETTKRLERKDLSLAIEQYLKGLKWIDEYASVLEEGSRRKGLIGMLHDEIEGLPELKGEVALLDRLTLCLKKLDRGKEAATLADEYFDRYPYDAKLSTGIAIQKRVNRLVGRPDPDKYPTHNLAPDTLLERKAVESHNTDADESCDGK